jgi:O-antigen/teichoic acid export membrane protein
MLARSVTLNVLGTGGSLLVGFVASLLLARWLGPTDRGLLALMIEIATVGIAIVALGLPMTVTYYASRRDTPRGALLGNTAAYGLLIAVVVIPLAWFGRGTLASAFGRGRGGEAWVLAGALVPLLFLDWTTHNQLLGKLRFGRYNVLVVLSRVATLALVVALVGVAGLGVTGGLLATAAASGVMIAGSLPVLLREARPRVDLAFFRQMVSYGRRVQVGSLLEFVNYRFDVIILQFFRPLRDVGVYVVAVILAELVITLSTAFGTTLMPLVSSLESDPRQRDTTIASLRHHAVLAVVAIALDAVAAPVLILLGYGHAFVPSLAPFFILLPGMWFLGTSAVVTNDLRGRGRPGTSSLLAGVVVVLTVVLDLVLIPPLGIDGAALASLIAYTVFGVLSLVVLARVVGVRARELALPTRVELAQYPAALGRVRARMRPQTEPC